MSASDSSTSVIVDRLEQGAELLSSSDQIGPSMSSRASR